jgi:MFS family permease
VSLTLAIIGRLYPENPAKAMARLTISYGTAQILGPIVAGYLSHATGNFRSALLFATAVGIVGTLLSLPLGRKQR